MTLPILIIDLDAASYSATLGNEILKVQVQNGPSRTRRDFFGAPAIVDAQWVLDDIEYQYLMAFYRTEISMGSLPFSMEMIIDYADPAQFECKLVPATLALSAKQGDAYIVKAQIEVKPIPTNTEFDTSLIMLFVTYGIGMTAILDGIAKLANVDMPRFLS